MIKKLKRRLSELRNESGDGQESNATIREIVESRL
jgi:hypothetical protein